MKKFEFVSYMEWAGNEYQTTTKIYASIPAAARKAIAEAENWDGCHWDDPAIIYGECVAGTAMSQDAADLIRILRATEMDLETINDN